VSGCGGYYRRRRKSGRAAVLHVYYEIGFPKRIYDFKNEL